MIIASQSSPLDYYGPHKDPLHSYGGYAPNFPPISTSLSRPKAAFELSTSKRDFTPPCISTPQESTSLGQVFLGRSGYSANKALHLPSHLEILRARRDLASDFYSLKSKLAGDCTIPTSLQTETYERMHPNSLTYNTCGGPQSAYWINSPGSRESGFTNCYSSVNPVFWRQHNPLMDQLADNEIRMNAASVSQVDYQPYNLVNYETTPIAGVIKVRGKGTGFTTSKELSKCFLPEPCIYSKSTPSYIDPRFETSYNKDYQNRLITCTTSGLEMISKPSVYKPKALSNESSPEFSLGCGAPRSFLSETRESFYNHWPLEGQRTLGLSAPISTVSPSGFTHSEKNHSKKVDPCAISVDALDTSPQRYNPWSRFYLGHQILVDKNYRPNPIRSGIDYTITTSLPTTGSDSSIFLY